MSGTTEIPFGEEKSIVKKLKAAEEMRRGAVWFPLAAKWWEAWTEYVNYDAEGESKEPGAPRPPPVANESLTTDEQPEGVLKAGLRENVDVVYVSQTVWNHFMEWYGGGPAFPRKVITIGVMEEARLELYPQPCHVHTSDDAGAVVVDSKLLLLSRGVKAATALDEAKRILEIAASAPARLWAKTAEASDYMLIQTVGGSAGAGAGDAAPTLDVVFGNDTETHLLVEQKVGGEFVREEPAPEEPAEPAAPEPSADGHGAHATRGQAGMKDGKVVDKAAWRAGLALGMRLDAQDSEKQWYESEIVEIAEGGNKLKVHFRGWETRWDSWFERSSENLQPLYTNFKNFRDFRVNDKVEMKLSTRDGPRWFEGNVVETDRTARKVKVKCINKHRDDVEWFEFDTEQLCRLGTHCKKAMRARTVGYGGWGFRENTAGRPVIEGAVGLVNLGNTCFMNSMLQCLSNAEPLTNFFLSGEYKRDLNGDNPLGHGGRLAEAYADMISDMWSGDYRVVCPTEFKRQIGIYAPQFAGFQQQDSQELMNFLLDGLHEDCNRVLKKPYVEGVESDGRPDDVVAKIAWERHQMRNKSHVLDTFGGQLRSHVECDKCDKVSITFDPFLSFSVPVPFKVERSLIFTLFPYDGSTPVQFMCRVPKDGCMRDMKEWLATEQGIPADNIIMADVYLHRVHAFLTNREAVRKIRDSDFIFAYSVPDVPEDTEEDDGKEKRGMLSAVRSYLGFGSGGSSATPDSNTAGICKMMYRRPVRVTSSYDRRVITRLDLFGEPRVLSLYALSGKNGQMPTNNQVHQAVFDQVKRLLEPKKAAAATDEEGKGDEAAEEGASGASGAGAEGASDKPEEETEDAPKTAGGGAGWTAAEAPYTLCVGDTGGTGDSTEIPHNDEPIKINPAQQALLLEFTLESYEEAWSREAMKDCIKSKSVEAQSGGSADAITLSDCLKKAFEREQLGEDDKWYCSSCSEHRCAYKKFDLWKLPEVFVVHLKRFQYSQGVYFVHRDKISCIIDFPHELDLGSYTVGPKEEGVKYELFAVSNHAGGMGGGHYTAFAKNFKDKTWYDFNDSHVSKADPRRLVTAQAYVLFYQRVRDEKKE